MTALWTQARCGVLWSDFVEVHNDRRGEALAAAASLLAGDPDPAVALLGAWRFSGDRDLMLRLLAALTAAPPRPDDRSRRILLTERLSAIGTEGDLALWLHREKLPDLGTVAVADTALHRVAWGLEELRSVGEQIESEQRRPWAARTFTPDPERDAHVADLWRGWLSGDPWSMREEWEALFLPIARRAFSVILEGRGIPRARQAYILADVAESATLMLLGSRETPPGWMEVAVRVLESLPPDPVAAMGQLLDERGWRKVALCAVSRGYGPASARLLYPEIHNPVQAARRLAAESIADPGRLDAVLDLHVAVRMLTRWSEHSDAARTERDWEVVRQNRGRGRARLRAVLSSGDPQRIAAPLLAAPALADRTRYAIGRYCRDWAWIQLSRHFPFHCHPVDALCGAIDHPPFSDDDRAAMRSWVLLVIIQGRLGHLERWIHSGGTGDRDATWGRLQKKLPPRLREEDSSGRMRRGLPRLRAELSELLPVILADWQPTLAALAALSTSDNLIPRFNAVLSGCGWHPDIPRPGGRYFKKYCASIEAALAHLRASEELK